VALCLLLAAAQVALAGYQLGVGNQAIQIAFLKRWADPTLFAADAMVRDTMPFYPSYFFRLLAPLLAYADVPTLYLLLQLATSFAALAAVYGLSRSIFRVHAAALAAAALLVAGHLRALAGDGLYSEGFTHTFAALPLAVAALALAFRGALATGETPGRAGGGWAAAFALAGVLFNIHALTAAYVLLMLGAGLLAEAWDLRRGPAKRWADWLLLAATCGAVATLCALPTLVQLVALRQPYDDAWVNLMRVRSADHSFPSSWWRAGDPDLPRFGLLLALFVVSWGYPPVRRAGAGAGDAVVRAHRITVAMTAAVLALFAAGYIWSEWRPWPLMIRLQPFRASRLLLVLMLVHIAHAAVVAIRAGWRGTAEAADGRSVRLPWAGRALEILAGAVVLATLAVPSLLPLLPVALVLAAAGALAAGRLSWRQGAAAGLGIVLAVYAHVRIGFPVPLLAGGEGVGLLPHGMPGLGANVETLGWLALAAAAIFAGFIGSFGAGWARRTVVTIAAAVGIALGWALFARERPTAGSGEGGVADASLVGIAGWAKENTPKDALFLAPSGLSNFRIAADRSLVGDWRDGTQLYFSSLFGDEWLDRVTAIEPGLTLSDDGRRLVARGEPLEDLRDADLLDLAGRYRATYILLRTPADQPRGLVKAYSDGHFTAYEPRLLPAATRPVPPGVTSPVAWQDAEAFMANTVLPNIEKNRKSDLTVQLVDAAGRPVQDVPVALDQTKLAFVAGCSLGFFEANTIEPADGDQRPGVVRPVELEKAPEVFNGSMIPFSSKWAFIEPEKGQYRWTDLDKYVDYCAAHDMTMEFHHLTGTRPQWMAAMGGPGGMTGLSFPPVNPAVQAEFLRHCDAVVGRYAGKIKYFQVSNEKYMMQYVPAAFKLLQAKYPDVRFGVSDCVNFLPAGQTNARYLKGFDAVDWLKGQGITPDFFSAHGHHPSNNWPDPRDMYRLFDTIRDAGVRIHLSEEYTQLGGSISGPLRTGTLTPELQAELLTRYFTVAFSYPTVDLVNIWGGVANSGFGTTNSGLIDAAGQTRPAFDALKTLFTQTWRSHVKATAGLDGQVRARVFQGTYRLAVTLPGGKLATAKVEVPAMDGGGMAKVKVRVDLEKGTLTVE
jgi:GH35 family endo-1,4-beta-xylanase